MKITSRRWWLASIAAAAVAVSAVLATVASAGAGATSSKPSGLGQSSGLLPPDHLTLESAIQVNLSKETVRLPLYPGTANGQKVWYVLLDASDAGLAHDLGVNYAPKLANIAISGPAAAARQQRAPMAAETWVSSPLLPPAESTAGYPARNTRNKGRPRSANFGVLAAVQLHEVGVVAARWLCDVGVLAAVQPHDAQAAPGDQLAQVPHPAHARERDS